MGCGAAIAAAAGVASAGVGIAGAAGAFAPGQPNYGAITQQQINAEINSLPQSYAAQAKYNPKFAGLNNTIAWQNLFGTPDTTGPQTATATQAGWYDAQGNFLGAPTAYNTGPTTARPGTAGDYPNWNGNSNPPPAGAVLRQAGQTYSTGVGTTPGTPGQLQLIQAAAPALTAVGNQTNTQARTAAINDVATLGPVAAGAIRTSDPSGAAALDSTNAAVMARLNNPTLDPFQQNQLEQNYRSAEAARGLAGGTGDAAMESYYVTSNANQMALQNIALGNTQVAANQGFYGDPFQEVLSRTSGSTAAIPTVNTTANQPNAVAGVGQSIPYGMSSLASSGYQAGLQGQQQSLAALQGILSPNSVSSLTGAYNTLAGYF